MPRETTPIRMMSIDEVATVLRVSGRTIRRLIQGGNLPAHRLGRQWRIAKTDLEGYLRRQRYGDAPDVL